MHVRHYVTPALWLPLMVIGAAQAGSQIRFQGTVVEAGCWNETGGAGSALAIARTALSAILSWRIWLRRSLHRMRWWNLITWMRTNS
ncbi:membrane protein [Salmonella bongori]|nr:membrane protein [Salmonella bongori]